MTAGLMPRNQGLRLEFIVEKIYTIPVDELAYSPNWLIYNQCS